MHKRVDGRSGHGAVIACTFAASLAIAGQARALALGTWDQPGVGGGESVTPSSVNTTAPTDDPGWANASASRSAIYLGNQWVLTADHVTAGSIELPSGTYEAIPGTEVTISNPRRFAGRLLSSQSDLLMYRIATHPVTGLSPEQMDPNVKPIALATESPSLGTEVVAIGSGVRRRVHPSNPNGHWRFDSNFALTGDASAPYRGYLDERDENNAVIREKAWGTNRIDNPSGVSSLSRSGANAVLSIPDLNDTIGFVARFDQAYDDAGNVVEADATEHEFQGLGGDSGGPVFAKNSQDEWELLGVFHGIFLINGQPESGLVPTFGMHTGFSDLSQPTYYNFIEALRGLTTYSVMGDTDLDGFVSGEIINGAATGDLGNIVDNWLVSHSGTGVGAWQQGDLNQDGVTDIGDFVLWRDAAGGTVSMSALASIVGGSAIPEPATAALVLLSVAGLAGRRRIA